MKFTPIAVAATTLLAALASSTALSAQTPAAAAHSYGDTLIAQTQQRDSHILALTISAKGKDGQDIVVSSARKTGAKAVTAPLANSMGEPIGTVTVQFDRRGGSAARIAQHIGRRIYVTENLRDADPFVPGAVRAAPAQAIIERMIDRHPDLVTLAMHVAPPGGSNIILASNFGRIGKLADKDDMHVINDGAILREVTNGGKRLAVELPQLDRSGKVIGALSTSFTVTADQSADQAYAKAIALRDEIAQATPSLEALTAR